MSKVFSTYLVGAGQMNSSIDHLQYLLRSLFIRPTVRLVLQDQSVPPSFLLPDHYTQQDCTQCLTIWSLPDLVFSIFSFFFFSACLYSADFCHPPSLFPGSLSSQGRQLSEVSIIDFLFQLPLKSRQHFHKYFFLNIF